MVFTWYIWIDEIMLLVAPLFKLDKTKQRKSLKTFQCQTEYLLFEGLYLIMKWKKKSITILIYIFVEYFTDVAQALIWPNNFCQQPLKVVTKWSTSEIYLHFYCIYYFMPTKVVKWVGILAFHTNFKKVIAIIARLTIFYWIFIYYHKVYLKLCDTWDVWFLKEQYVCSV